MILEKSSALKPLIESSEGVHLSAYLVNNLDDTSFHSQIKYTLSTAHMYLESVMNREGRAKFLAPLQTLLDEPNIMKSIKGNVGLFRTQNSFRMVKIPIEIERLCILAKSFHVKPLLRWMQVDRDFLLLHLESDGFKLYQGNQFEFNCKEIIHFSDVLPRKGDRRLLPGTSSRFLGWEEKVDFVSEWILRRTMQLKPRLFVTGDNQLTEPLLKRINSPFAPRAVGHVPLFDRKVFELCRDIRGILRKEARRTIEQAFIEFESAEKINLADRNIYRIAQAAIQGRVKKLIIADGINIFGKINPRTGNIAIHPGQINHEDDDILDDLAQTVLAQGGEVVIADRVQIPKRRPVLAILYDQGSDVSLSLPYQDYYGSQEWRLSV